MKIFSIALIIIYNIVFFYGVIKKKNIFGLGTIINFSVNLNFILYLCKWSRFIETEPSISMYILIDSIVIIFIVIMLLSKSPVNKLLANTERIILKDINFFNGKVNLYILINIIYILLFLLENYIGSGNMFPYLFGIDIHTYSAPLISFVTRAVYVMIFLNYISYENYKQKRFLIFLVIDILLFPVLRGGRINIFMALMQFGLFYIMYNLKNILKNKRILVVIFSLGIMLIISGVYIGNKRVEKNLEGHELQQVITYKDHIKYSGPVDSMGILPWYYGYFPMSFANLDKTIQYIDDNQLRTYGLYTVRPILVGLLELDNIIPNYKDIEYASSLAQYYTTAATVRTGFMEFYLDFGKLAGIGIAIYALIGLFMYNVINKNIYIISAYAFFAGCWFFMSFQNMMIDVTTLYGLIYLFLIYKFCTVRLSNNGSTK